MWIKMKQLKETEARTVPGKRDVSKKLFEETKEKRRYFMWGKRR